MSAKVDVDQETGNVTLTLTLTRLGAESWCWYLQASDKERTDAMLELREILNPKVLSQESRKEANKGDTLEATIAHAYSEAGVLADRDAFITAWKIDKNSKHE